MVIPTVNFLCYNSTGLNTIKADWIRNLYKVTDCNFISIQEHFKKNKNTDKFFKDQFPEHISYVIPGHREQNQDSGRPKGGIAQMIDKKLNVKTDRVATSSFRIQAQILNFPASRVLWLNTYFPTDPGLANFDEEELLELLGEIENLMDKTDFDDILWNGDLNFDKSRNTAFVNTMTRFLSRIGLESAWDYFPVDHTHVHTDFKTTSTLDHFIMNKRLLALIDDCGVVHLGDNPSRHSPIILKLKVGDIPVKSEERVKRQKKPAWYKASQENKEQFTVDLEERLSSLLRPDTLQCMDSNCKDVSHSQERDSHVLDILISVIESSHTCIPISGGGKLSNDPTKSCPVTEAVPGWKDEVESRKQDSLFWHAVWRSAGSPHQGDLFNFMKSSRNIYHYVVRKVKKKSDLLRAQKLLEASENGSMDLLREMKRVRGGSKIKSELTENLEGANGEENIAEKFCQVYEELYKSSGTGEALDNLKHLVSNMLADDSETESQVLRITGEVVKEAACKLKSGKGDVTEGYTSDAILNAPDILFDMLASVYKSWLIHGTVSLNLLACAFLPLLKSSLKNPAEANSYRAIAGSSLLLKLFDQVILLLWGHLLSSDSLQFGYKAGFSTTQCTWLVMEVASYFLRKRTPCIVTLLDCTKAFDKCKFDILFGKLVDRKVPAVVIRVLLFVYEEQYAWVKWGKTRSRTFGVVNGTRQGSVLSPALFSVYMDDLIVRLRKSGVGCHIGGVFCGVVGYADDLLLMAPSRSAMEKMLTLCEDYAGENNLEFSTDPNPAKSKSKCIFMCCHLKKAQPAIHQLYGVVQEGCLPQKSRVF